MISVAWRAWLLVKPSVYNDVRRTGASCESRVQQVVAASRSTVGNSYPGSAGLPAMAWMPGSCVRLDWIEFQNPVCDSSKFQTGSCDFKHGLENHHVRVNLAFGTLRCIYVRCCLHEATGNRISLRPLHPRRCSVHHMTTEILQASQR